MLLCAGLGVRLRPLTDQLPKPLLKFIDRPIADYGLEALRQLGVARIGVNAHHLPDAVGQWLRFKADQWPEQTGVRPQTDLVVEETLMGTGGGAYGIWEKLSSPKSTVAVLNGDVVAEFPLEAMWKVHRRTGAVATLMMMPAQTGESPVWLDPTGNFIAQVPSPNGEWNSPRYQAHTACTFGGVYLLEHAVFERLSNETSCLIRNGIGPLLAEGAVVAAYRYDGFWADLGTPKRFLDATIQVLDDPTLLPSATVRPRSDRIFIADRKTVAPSATINGPAFIAEGAIVGPGAQIGPGVVIGSDCEVGAGIRVENSVLMNEAVADEDVSGRLVSGAASVRVAR
ncbi:MAG: mannose-1-phosphate guanylyltransferase [Bradymonadia bacterium]|jgi:mannose-1-phosphate guanylyltransferase